ncbi:family 43 glycosylhydrolase [Sunxiuqinia sp. A32]|uniref:family 43 glycosylhydrolase n=1 Tax=Sunxiuqinia sp. A32 TaxID=3461496 RepID=UPI0040456268
MYRHLYLIILSVLMSCSQSPKIVNQLHVIPGDLPDPSVIEVDGTFYASGTSGNWGPVYPIYKSTDLENWSFVSYVFQDKPDWTINSFWAPELFYFNDTYYCYYTARRKDGISCIGVATTKDIEKGFEDKGVIIDWGSEAIDAFVYDENGKLYITWKAYGLDPKPIQLLVSELSDDGLSLVGEPWIALTTESDTWEDGMMEGQCIIPRDDYLYMLYSGNGCCGPGCNYMVGVARAKSMKGPWEKYDKNPIIKGNYYWKCPGHGTAVQKENQWFYLYHAYNTHNFPQLGRTALLSSIQWNPETGWPSFEIPTDSTDIEIKKENVYDTFEDDHLNYWWHQPIDKEKLEVYFENENLIMIEGAQKADSIIDDVLCLIPHDINYTVTTQLTENNASLKGLVFYAYQRNAIGFGKKGNTLMIWQVKNGEFSTLAELEEPPTSDSIYLQATVVQNKQLTFRYSYDNASWKELTADDETQRFEWWGNGFKPGIFVKTFDQTSDGKGVFGLFELEY